MNSVINPIFFSAISPFLMSKPTLFPESRRILVEHQLWSEFDSTSNAPSIKYRCFEEPLNEIYAKQFDSKNVAKLALVNKKFQRLINVYLCKSNFQVIVTGDNEKSSSLILENKLHRIYCQFPELKRLRAAGLLKWKPQALQVFHMSSFPEWTIYTAEFTELEQLCIAPVHPTNPELKSVLNNATQLITNSAKSLKKLRCNQAILKHSKFPPVSLQYCGSPVFRINGKIYGLRPPKSESLNDSATQFSLLERTREVDEVRPVEALLAQNIRRFDLEAHSYITFNQLRRDFKLNSNIKELKFGWESDSLEKTAAVLSTFEKHGEDVEKIVFSDKQIAPSHLRDFDYTQLLKYARKFKDYSELTFNSKFDINFTVEFWLIQSKKDFLRFQHEDGLYSKQIEILYSKSGLKIQWINNDFALNLNEFEDNDLSRKIQVFANTLKNSVDKKNIPNGPHRISYY
ncbi:unnamed protein product [Bursaphelenchus xylophilus]|uniref:(pine wood nematode) hypothetical protein n=1 Tax=Bursaphelenchus xylophilus TaxID=6326 RepID=A0A1I7SKX2_BURXY|nr:unnamed protein product [Bursaphelenchus xylophilus]CAG9129277.1 unnamed protein product [Bursaphelenchus xylophilus]